jgi:hypothetical protein
VGQDVHGSGARRFQATESRVPLALRLCFIWIGLGFLCGAPGRTMMLEPVPRQQITQVIGQSATQLVFGRLPVFVFFVI